MGDMQTAILDAIANLVPDGLAVRRQPKFANTGQVLSQRGFTTVLQLAYDFQDSYFGVHISRLDKNAELPSDLAVGVHEPAARPANDGPWYGWNLDYTDGPGIERMLAAISHLIRTRAAALTAAASAS